MTSFSVTWGPDNAASAVEPVARVVVTGDESRNIALSVRTAFHLVLKYAIAYGRAGSGSSRARTLKRVREVALSLARIFDDEFDEQGRVEASDVALGTLEMFDAMHGVFGALRSLTSDKVRELFDLVPEYFDPNRLEGRLTRDRMVARIAMFFFPVEESADIEARWSLLDNAAIGATTLRNMKAARSSATAFRRLEVLRALADRLHEIEELDGDRPVPRTIRGAAEAAAHMLVRAAMYTSIGVQESADTALAEVRRELDDIANELAAALVVVRIRVVRGDGRGSDSVQVITDDDTDVAPKRPRTTGDDATPIDEDEPRSSQESDADILVAEEPSVLPPMRNLDELIAGSGQEPRRFVFSSKDRDDLPFLFGLVLIDGATANLTAFVRDATVVAQRFMRQSFYIGAGNDFFELANAASGRLEEELGAADGGGVLAFDRILLLTLIERLVDVDVEQARQAGASTGVVSVEPFSEVNVRSLRELVRVDGFRVVDEDGDLFGRLTERIGDADKARSLLEATFEIVYQRLAIGALDVDLPGGEEAYASKAADELVANMVRLARAIGRDAWQQRDKASEWDVDISLGDSSQSGTPPLATVGTQWCPLPIGAGEGKRAREGDQVVRTDEEKRAAELRSAEWRVELQEIPMLPTTRLQWLLARLDAIDADFHTIVEKEWPGFVMEWREIVRRRNIYHMAIALEAYEAPELDEEMREELRELGEEPESAQRSEEITKLLSFPARLSAQIRRELREQFIDAAKPVDMMDPAATEKLPRMMSSRARRTLRNIINDSIAREIAAVKIDRLERLRLFNADAPAETRADKAMFWSVRPADRPLRMYADNERLMQRDLYHKITPAAMLLPQMEHARAMWNALSPEIQDMMNDWKGEGYTRLRPPFQRTRNYNDFDTKTLADSIIVNELCHMGRLNVPQYEPLLVYHGQEDLISPGFGADAVIARGGRRAPDTFLSCSFRAEIGLVKFGAVVKQDSFAIELDNDVPFFDYNFRGQELLPAGEREIILPASVDNVIDTTLPFYERIRLLLALHDQLKEDRERCLEILRELRNRPLRLQLLHSVVNPVVRWPTKEKDYMIHYVRCSL